jgi:hypothetical protein
MGKVRRTKDEGQKSEGWKNDVWGFCNSLPGETFANKTGHFGKKLGSGKRVLVGGSAWRVSV